MTRQRISLWSLIFCLFYSGCGSHSVERADTGHGRHEQLSDDTRHPRHDELSVEATKIAESVRIEDVHWKDFAEPLRGYIGPGRITAYSGELHLTLSHVFPPANVDGKVWIKITNETRGYSWVQETSLGEGGVGILDPGPLPPGAVLKQGDKLTHHIERIDVEAWGEEYTGTMFHRHKDSYSEFDWKSKERIWPKVKY